VLVIWQGEIANGARDDETQKKDKDNHSAYTMCVLVNLQNEKVSRQAIRQKITLFSFILV